MFRRLIAFAALLTGLAAIGVPAHAEIVGDMIERMEVSADKKDAAKQHDCECAEQQRLQKLKGQKPKPCEVAQPIRIYVPTVMLGADRAYE